MKIKITKSGLTMGGRMYKNGQVFRDKNIPADLKQFTLNGGTIGGKKFATVIKRKRQKK